MITKRNFLKVVSSLFIWTIIVIGLFSLYISEIEQPDCVAVMQESRLLLQKVLQSRKSISVTNQSELLVDNRADLGEKQNIYNIEARFPSLPIVYWSMNKHLKPQINDTCAKYPSIFALSFNNIYWQTIPTSDGTFQLYGAYYDKRVKSALGPSVRILGMIDRVDMQLKTFCQFWFLGFLKPIIEEIFGYRYIWQKELGNYVPGSYQPYQIICRIPKNYYGFVPNSVSLVEKECDMATNNLRVIYNPPPDDRKKSFAVCVRPLNFLYEDVSVRLIEWIEMLNILGADKIYFYHLQLHPNVSRVLSHYEQEGKVEVMPVTLPGRQPNAPGLQQIFLNTTTYVRQQNENIQYNDCLFKNMYLYDYITTLDIDEIIMPKDGASNWSEMMKNVLREALKQNSNGYQSYCYQNLPELQPNRVNNSKDPIILHSKCFYNTERVYMVHNHLPLGCLDGACTSYQVGTEIAQLYHYRAVCVGFEQNCKKFSEEKDQGKTDWNYTNILRIRTKKKLAELGYLRRRSNTTAS